MSLPNHALQGALSFSRRIIQNALQFTIHPKQCDEDETREDRGVGFSLRCDRSRTKEEEDERDEDGIPKKDASIVFVGRRERDDDDDDDAQGDKKRQRRHDVVEEHHHHHRNGAL